MSRTKRRKLAHDRGWNNCWVQVDARDDGCQHWACNRWKRPARRKARHDSKRATKEEA